MDDVGIYASQRNNNNNYFHSLLRKAHSRNPDDNIIKYTHFRCAYNNKQKMFTVHLFYSVYLCTHIRVMSVRVCVYVMNSYYIT